MSWWRLHHYVGLLTPRNGGGDWYCEHDHDRDVCDYDDIDDIDDGILGGDKHEYENDDRDNRHGDSNGDNHDDDGDVDDDVNDDDGDNDDGNVAGDSR